MKNLDMDRAKMALDLNTACGVKSGNIMSGLPDKIVKNGLLATLAFLISKTREGDYIRVGDAIALHLAALGLVPNSVTSLDALFKTLVAGSGQDLKAATSEVLALLVIAKRIVKKE